MWNFLSTKFFRTRRQTWQPLDRPPDNWNYSVVTESLLKEAAQRLDVSLVGERAYGLGRKSAGAIAVAFDGTRQWLRLSGLIGSRHDARREAEVESQTIRDVPKPTIHRTFEWVKDDVFWRASLMTLASSPIVSPCPWLAAGQAGPPDHWFPQLQSVLDKIRQANTHRITASAEEVKAIIVGVFGRSVRSLATDWCIGHGDLHWSNVTAPELMILDWENWGWAPRGYDAARLIAYAGLVPAVQDRLARLFADDLQTPSGQVSLLLAIARVKQDIVAGHADPALTESLDELVKTALR